MAVISVKEQAAIDVMQLLNEPTIAHDDRLLLRGQKHLVGLEVGFRDATAIQHDATGKPVIVSYHAQNESGEHERISPEHYSQLDVYSMSRFRPQFLRGINLGSGAALIMRDNQFDLVLTNLFDDLGSRYRKALEAMVELQGRGILRYSPRAQPSERNKLEAMRNRLRRTLKPTAYEHNIMFRGLLGRRIYDELARCGKAKKVFAGTVYMQGFKPYQGRQTSVKYYDIGKRDGTEPGQYFKLETTMHKGYFKYYDIGIRSLTEQPAIQEDVVKNKLTQSIGSIVSALTGDLMQALQLELSMNESGKADRKHTDIALNMLDQKRTLTERVQALERDVSEVKRQQRERDKQQRERDKQQRERDKQQREYEQRVRKLEESRE